MAGVRTGEAEAAQRQVMQSISQVAHPPCPLQEPMGLSEALDLMKQRDDPDCHQSKESSHSGWHAHRNNAPRPD